MLPGTSDAMVMKRKGQGRIRVAEMLRHLSGGLQGHLWHIFKALPFRSLGQKFV